MSFIISKLKHIPDYLAFNLSSLNPLAKTSSQAKNEDIKIETGRLIGPSWLTRNFLSIPRKILLWNSKVNSGNVSQKTLDKMRNYLKDNNLNDVNISVNQYKPQMIWKRTFTNPKTSTLSKIFLGIPSCLFYTTGISKLTGFNSTSYNPLSNTIQISSDNIPLALHECGNALNYNSRKNPGFYTFIWFSSGKIFSLATEYIASNNAIEYLKENDSTKKVSKAFKTLVPKFFTDLLIPLFIVPAFPVIKSIYSHPFITYQIIKGNYSHQFINSAAYSLIPLLGTIGISAVAGHIIGDFLAYENYKKEEKTIMPNAEKIV